MFRCRYIMVLYLNISTSQHKDTEILTSRISIFSYLNAHVLRYKDNTPKNY